jgi:hypothetical protein
MSIYSIHVGVLKSLWLLLFAVRPKEFFLDGLKKLEQRSHKCVELTGNVHLVVDLRPTSVLTDRS